MHIAIDTSPMAGGHKYRGTGSYTKSLIEALQKYGKDHMYSFFTRGEKVPKNADLVHYPYFDPFFLTLPLQKTIPTVVTVHDLIPLVYSGKFAIGLRGHLKWTIQRFSLRSASAIITDSYASQEDIHNITKFPKEKIHVVYLAPSKKFQNPLSQAVCSAMKEKFHLPETFVLYIGDVNWNKNVEGLVRAFASLKSSKRYDKVSLVLGGKPFLDASLVEARSIHALIAELHIENDVITPGFLSDEELACIYRLAAAYVQPSFAEGFGLPILEAMASGCPVVAASGSSLDEIAGPAIRVDPHRSDDIARGIGEALNIKDGMLKKKQTEWVKQYSWQKTAKETICVYEEVLEKH